ncbi:hypothetical protein BW723_12840 [Polaribacter reichenbachii]|uniref:Uncharacterized protein n=1 Tax=Polaribacter reichenbachii TaxID=996801 RepID=A0A1B8U021_9FLAO|nr:hypothetical protein BW723_12840 [Polaribacter reichenbachii]AUC17756.1 hypothetical protein BTO17_03290 [Polaribacter reichenbachii]OBY65221.1 hypothetical protein LPB301_08935 [Polaribacter reichenbachii]
MPTPCKKIASKSLLTKILADFLFGFYLLNYVLNHATKHTKTRCKQAENKIVTLTKNSKK